VLDTLDSGLTRLVGSVKAGPIASQGIASYKSGLEWLDVSGSIQ
jgi:hypothetical protein